jgi:phosphoenolpyruvate-protein phosphotransferase (PTS system enzyme I)
MSLALWGSGVSRGIGIGQVFLDQDSLPEIGPYTLSKSQIRGEVARFEQALAAARARLQELRQELSAALTGETLALLEVHQLMLEDRALAEDPVRLIYAHRCNAEWAVKLQRDSLVTRFATISDPYLGSRVQDVDHVVCCLLRALLEQRGWQDDWPLPAPGSVLVSSDLSPTDALTAQQRGVAGVLLEHGGPISHTAIVLRSLGIPAVVGVHHARTYLRRGEIAILDGGLGAVIAEPDERTLKHFRDRSRGRRRRAARLAALTDAPAATLDGVHVNLWANIELPEDIAAVGLAAVAGVGLYRTEFLFMNRSEPPEEEEQLNTYLSVVNALQGRPLTVRTLDLAPDKPAPGLAKPASACPLGLRALRLCMHNPDLFLCQIRAILRAAARGPVRMLLPMVTNLEELARVKTIVSEAGRQLAAEGLEHCTAIPIGCMVEVPAAAVCADIFTQHVDFLSIGTNDLIQYTLAVDRTDESVSYLYDPLHPAVLRLVVRVIRAGRQARVSVALCGEMAGDPRYTRLLLGLGLREFSMYPAALPEIKDIIRHSHVGLLRQRVRRALGCRDPEALGVLLDEINQDLFLA